MSKNFQFSCHNISFYIGTPPEYPGYFPEISRKFRRGPYVKTDIVTRELKIFWHDLHEMNSVIILDSPVEYLENVKSDQKWHLLPTPALHMYSNTLDRVRENKIIAVSLYLCTATRNLDLSLAIKLNLPKHCNNRRSSSTGNDDQRYTDTRFRLLVIAFNIRSNISTKV